MSELLPCPFCGGDPTIQEWKDEALWDHSIVPWFRIRCSGCDVHGPDCCDDRLEAVTHWNTRTILTDAERELAHGAEYPYHDKPPRDAYERAVCGILSELSGRGGIGDALSEVDDVTKREIVSNLADIVHAALPGQERAAPLDDDEDDE